MPPTDVDAAVDPASTPFSSRDSPTNQSDPGASTDNEETLDLRLTGELLTLYEAATTPRATVTHSAGAVPSADAMPSVGRFPSAGAGAGAGAGVRTEATPTPMSTATEDLLDHIATWAPVSTPVGAFHLAPVRIDRDVPLISRWMNDPAVAEFWELAGPPHVTAKHVRTQLDGDGRSVPCLGVLDGVPMSYWEIYRADLDPLARHYPARPHDTGIHLLIGGAPDRGRGVGGALIRAVSDLVLGNRRSCARVVAEPDLRNTPSISAFLTAGFRFSAEADLPAKRAALMIRERALRHAL
ncbi:GNAT family N-acetyltransferase [Streptomyces griseoviridis]|uniref:GNAT family N-acetyltransferase n=1 Tax=Streptomyces griseoviridis TaxID=45398 RepID=UPI00344F02A5